MYFYGFEGFTSDYDVFLDRVTFPPDLVEAIKQVAEENGLSSTWMNHEINTIMDQRVDSYYEMKEHVVEDLKWELQNENGKHVMTLAPISVPCICRNKFSPACFRDKDARHLEYIARTYNLRTPKNMIDFILEEYPYIEDELYWDDEVDNITKFYDSYSFI